MLYTSLPCHGKEELNMGEDKKANQKRKRIASKGQVQMIISREYIGKTAEIPCLADNEWLSISLFHKSIYNVSS